MEHNDEMQNSTVCTADSQGVPSQDLKTQILEKIETEAVTPRARWVYSTQEYALWAVWGLTVFVGALSVAITFFVFSHQRFALYELTHRNFVTFAVDVLPTLWLVLFVSMVAFAVFNMRHTKRGYRYPLWQIFGSSVLLSLALGALLHLAGAGFSLDKKIGAWASGYPSQEKIELKWWQNPKEGRLVGTAEYVRESGGTGARFIDVTGVVWQLDSAELLVVEKQLLEAGRQVRLFGVIQPGSVFYACGAMPWVYDRAYVDEELATIRRETRAKMNAFRDEKIAMIASSTVCGELIRRVPKPPVAW